MSELKINFLCLNTMYVVISGLQNLKDGKLLHKCNYLILCLSPLMGRDKLERINSNLIKHNSSIWTNFPVHHDAQTVSKNSQLDSGTPL